MKTDSKIQHSRFWRWTLLCLFATGCGGSDNFLDGSISKRFELDFDHVVLFMQDEGYVVRYLDKVDFPEVGYHAENTILEMTLTGDLSNMQLGEWSDSTGVVEVQRFVVVMPEKYVIEQDTRPFPEINSVELVVHERGAAPGERLTGQFSIGFVDGSTLRGGFSGIL